MTGLLSNSFDASHPVEMPEKKCVEHRENSQYLEYSCLMQ